MMDTMGRYPQISFFALCNTKIKNPHFIEGFINNNFILYANAMAKAIPTVPNQTKAWKTCAAARLDELSPQFFSGSTATYIFVFHKKNPFFSTNRLVEKD